MNLQELRNEIDEIDDQLISLFVRRMAISAQVAQYKRAHGLPVHIPEREQAILQAIGEKVGPKLSVYAKALYATLFRVSRDYQTELISHDEVIE